MAGDWLKMECSTPDKPEVLAITAHMGWDDPDLTVVPARAHIPIAYTLNAPSP